MAEQYAAADAFLHPNPREPYGIAPLEAMASGVPLVAPLSGGVLSFANQANAWLAEPSGQSFARAIRDLFEHPDIAATKCSLARQVAENLAWESVIAEYFGLYQQLQGRILRWQAGENAAVDAISSHEREHEPSHRKARLVYRWNDIFRAGRGRRTLLGQS
jgi:glycogen synthase